MTRSDALDIASDLPKSLEDLTVQIERRGVDALIAALEDISVDGEAFILALSDDLLEAAPHDFVRDAVADSFALLEQGPLSTDTEIDFGKHAGSTVQEIADEDEGYAEWAAENLDDKPRLAAAFSEALN